MSDKNANRRARNWCAVVYPDSAPDNWESLLDSRNLNWACSPLHDKDVNDDSEASHLKKAHWHIVICYSGNKSFDQVREDLDGLNCPIPQICRDVRSTVRYFTHKDHPHKFQYSFSDIRCYGGFDVADYYALSKSEKNLILNDIAQYIEDNNIKEFAELDSYVRHNHFDDWFDVYSHNTIYLDRIIKSNRHRKQKTYDSDTGEIYD